MGLYTVILKGKVGTFMDRTRLIPRLCFLTSMALTLVGVTLRILCMLTQFDATIGYFDKGVLPTIGSALYFVAVVAAVVMVLLIPKDALGTDLHTPHRAPFAYAMGFVLVSFTVLSFIASYATLFTAGGLMKTLMTLSAILAATYFLLTAGRHGRYRDGLIWMGFLPFVWAMSAIAVTYADPFVAMNSPIKISLQMGLLGFMLIMLSELRFRLGKASPRSAVALTSIGTFCAINASLPILVASPVINDPLYLLCAGVLLMVGIYGGYMLFCYTFRPAGSSCEDTDIESDIAPGSPAPQA